MISLPTVLTRTRVLASLSVMALLLVASLATAPPSDASICKTFGLQANCRIVFGGEKSNGNGGGGGGGGKTRPPCNLGAPDFKGVPCQDAVAGTWSNEKQCYVIASLDQPDASDPTRPKKGNPIYYTCTGVNEEGELIIRESFWSVTPPKVGNTGSLQEDLERALSTKFRAMRPGVAPNPVPQSSATSKGWRMAPVGLPVWLWARPNWDSVWDPERVEDEETGYYVDAVVTRLKWEMDDGTVEWCGKGEPFMPYMKNREPECGHKYKRPGNYLVRVTTFWRVDYQDARGPGKLFLEMPQSFRLRIGENQVINK